MMEAARSEAAIAGAAAALGVGAFGSAACAADSASAPGNSDLDGGRNVLKSSSPFGAWCGPAGAGLGFAAVALSAAGLLSVFLEKPIVFPKIEKATEDYPVFLMDQARPR